VRIQGKERGMRMKDKDKENIQEGDGGDMNVRGRK
jgi:hypothetical protein